MNSNHKSPQSEMPEKDPLAPARGAVFGVLLGSIGWLLICLVIMAVRQLSDAV